MQPKTGIRSSYSYSLYVTAGGQATGGITVYQRSSNRGRETIVVVFVIVEKRFRSTCALVIIKTQACLSFSKG
jgi:hypothetical protein